MKPVLTQRLWVVVCAILSVGHLPKFGAEDLNALRNGTGPIITDLKQLLEQHITQLSEREDIVRIAGKML